MKMNASLFSDLLFCLSPLGWQRVLERSKIMRGILNRVILIILDGLTREHCIAAYLFTKGVMRIGKKSGSFWHYT